jgi:hypothetical protein
MNATELRLGNIVAAIDEPAKPDVVIVLEPGIVQLMSRSEEDDENNILSKPLENLAQAIEEICDRKRTL